MGGGVRSGGESREWMINFGTFFVGAQQPAPAQQPAVLLQRRGPVLRSAVRLAVVQAGSDALGVAGRGDEPSELCGTHLREAFQEGAAAEGEEVAIYVGATVRGELDCRAHCRNAAVLVGAG